MLDGVADICSMPDRGCKLFYGILYPYQQDESRANITVENSEIRVSTVTKDEDTYIYQAFGEPIRLHE